MSDSSLRLSHSDLLELKRWNTPSIYNGWEQVTQHNIAADGFNLEDVRDFMPQMGPMVGYAVTVVFEPSNAAHPRKNFNAKHEYRRYVASWPGPKIVVVQDLDKPRVIAAFWGEVNANIHRSLGCVGTITDGAIRDLDEMTNAGFKALARRLAVGHAHACPVRWGCEVEVFGRKIHPDQLIHADKHGFLAIPSGDEKNLLEAVRFMDTIECRTIIPAARGCLGKTFSEACDEMEAASRQAGRNVRERFNRKGEW